jgi:ArsR family transcriptional regulator
VIAIVRESYAGLVRSAKLTAHMIPLTERFARQRLADLTRDRSAGVPQVLFVCVQNAGRSQLAAAIVNQLRRPRSSHAPQDHAPASTYRTCARCSQRSKARKTPGRRSRSPHRRRRARRRRGGHHGLRRRLPDHPRRPLRGLGRRRPGSRSPEGVEAIRHDIEGRVRDLLATLTD